MSRKLILLFTTTTIIILSVALAVATTPWEDNTKRIANLHGKILPHTPETIEINLGNLTVGERFKTGNYTLNLPLHEKQNITIWLGDNGWCSFGIFEHFNISGIVIGNGKRQEISADLAHSNLHISNCSPEAKMIFKIEGRVGYPKITEIETLPLDNLHLVLFTEN